MTVTEAGPEVDARTRLPSPNILTELLRQTVKLCVLASSFTTGTDETQWAKELHAKPHGLGYTQDFSRLRNYTIVMRPPQYTKVSK